MRVSPVLFAVALVAGCDSLQQMESSFQGRLADLDACAARVDPAKRAEVLANKAAFAAEYARLPADRAQREALLGPLNQRSRAVIQACQTVADQQAASAQAAAGAQQQAQSAALRQALVGNWQGAGMTLAIAPNGAVSYRRQEGASTRSVDAPMTAITPGSFEVGFMGITTTFRIDRPPHDEGGVMKMTIDGVELTRVQ